MDIWTLRVFEAVLAKGSISGAAHAVGRTQSRVTRIIKELEAEVGFSLFNRAGNALIPTTRCAPFAIEAQRVIDEMARLNMTARSLKAGASTIVNMLAPPHALSTILPKIIGEVHRTSPHYRFEVAQLKRDSSGRWEEPSPFDIAFGMLPFRVGRVVERPLGTINHAVVVPRDHPLSALESADLSDLALYPYIAYRQAMPLRQHLDAAFEKAGIEPNIVATAPDSLIATQLVLAGVGFAFVDPIMATAYGQERVSLVPYKGLPDTTFGMAVSQDFNDAELEGKLFNAARNALNELPAKFFRALPLSQPNASTGLDE